MRRGRLYSEMRAVMLVVLFASLVKTSRSPVISKCDKNRKGILKGGVRASAY